MAGGRVCGTCRTCIRGRFEECEAFEIMGFNFDGAWAQYVVVPYAGLTRVPDGLPVEQAAILADAVSTPYAALTDRAGLRPGESIGLWGIGGLGVHAVQVARLVGAAPIIAFDPLPSARERALALGADVALDPLDGDVVARVRDLTGGRMLDVAVDLVGANAVLAQAASLPGPVRPVRHGRAVARRRASSARGCSSGCRGSRCSGTWATRSATSTSSSTWSGTAASTCPGRSATCCRSRTSRRGVERLTSKQGDPIRLVVQPWP